MRVFSLRFCICCSLSEEAPCGDSILVAGKSVGEIPKRLLSAKEKSVLPIFLPRIDFFADVLEARENIEVGEAIFFGEFFDKACCDDRGDYGARFLAVAWFVKRWSSKRSGELIFR